MNVGTEFYFPTGGNFVPAISLWGGGSVGFYAINSFEPESTRLNWSLGVTPTAYHFLTDNVAIDASLSIYINNSHELTDHPEAQITHPDYFENMLQNLDISSSINVGMTVFIPHSDYFIISQ